MKGNQLLPSYEVLFVRMMKKTSFVDYWLD